MRTEKTVLPPRVLKVLDSPEQWREEISRGYRKALPQAINTLFKLLFVSDSRIRLAAAIYITDRNLGKPGQSLEVTGKDGRDLLPIRLVEIVRDVDALQSAASGEVIEGQARPLLEEAALEPGQPVKSLQEAYREAYEARGNEASHP